jgi:DNA-binding winged helix-turn-helix (wHTH) protein
MLYTFAGCTLDTNLHTLHRDGVTMPLRPKVFKVLLYLLERGERVVSRQELGQHVWANPCMKASALESTIREIRQVLGEDRQNQQIIQTQRGYGYRCVSLVERYPSPQPQSVSSFVLFPEAEDSSPIVDTRPAILGLHIIDPEAGEQTLYLPVRFCPMCGQKLERSPRS